MSLHLEILVPDSVVVRTNVKSVQAADASGRFGLLPGHEPFLTLLVPCVLLYREEDNRERYAAIDGGVLSLEKDRVSVVTHEAITADRLEEVADAAASMMQSRREREKLARTEFAELQSALLQELHQVEQTR